MGIGFQELLVILVIIVLLFGTKKLKNVGTDLGGAIKGFRSAMKEGQEESTEKLTQINSETMEKESVKDKETV